MSLRVIEGGRPPDAPNDGPRVLASGAPPSPGPVPKALAVHLRHGEALVWWNAKEAIQWGPVALTLAGAGGILAMVSAFAPALWTGPWSSLWPALMALASPVLFIVVREWLSRRAVLVTDGAIIEVEPGGAVHRLSFAGVVAVRRDLLRGGVRLLGTRDEVRIPQTLMTDARAAIASQKAVMLRSGASVDDAVGWMP